MAKERDIFLEFLSQCCAVVSHVEQSWKATFFTMLLKNGDQKRSPNWRLVVLGIYGIKRVVVAFAKSTPCPTLYMTKPVLKRILFEGRNNVALHIVMSKNYRTNVSKRTNAD